MAACPACTREQPASAAVCAACGAVLAPVCSTCDHTNAPGSNFCSQCGVPVQAGARTAVVSQPDRSDAEVDSRQSRVESPRSYTPRHLAEKILSSRAALTGERKQVTVFFVDVKESMLLSEGVDPEEWHRIMDRFFAILGDGIHRFEGTINQFTGDGAMALFGAPLAHEDHAQRACHAALHVREQLRLYAQELKRTRGLTFAVRMGLNSGEVIVGSIGDDLRLDYTAQGHTVGLAARMQQIAEAGAIYLTAHTAALVSGFFELEAVGKIRLKGVREAVRTFALVDAGAIRTRLDASRARGFTHFVGRGDEAAVLEGALSRAIAGHGQVIGVVGAAGVGKSRLCQEAVDRWRAEGLAVAEAHCPSHGKSLPYGTLLDLLRSFFALNLDERATVSRRRVRSRLQHLHRALEEELPLVLDFLGLADAKSPPPAMAAGERRDRLFAFVRRLVQTHSANEPTVLLIDDVHWIDQESNAVLAELVDAVGWTRTLVLLNFRPEYAPEWESPSYYQQLELLPLTPDAAGALLRGLVGADTGVAAICALIQERAEGNPFFMEEIVQSLVDQGILVRERSAGGPDVLAGAVHMQVARPVAEIRIPATVQSVLAARIDSLDEPVKHVLQTAAVIGKRFAEPVLRIALGMDPAPPEQRAGAAAEVGPALRALQVTDLIRSEPSSVAPEYVFKHSLIQEVAYGSQLQETRERRHRAAAQALEIVYADRLGEHAALLAHHLEAANRRYEAQLWRRRAALRVTNILVRRDRARRSS
jgi:class 3 adenylate cyclase